MDWSNRDTSHRIWTDSCSLRRAGTGGLAVVSVSRKKACHFPGPYQIVTFRVGGNLLVEAMVAY